MSNNLILVLNSIDSFLGNIFRARGWDVRKMEGWVYPHYEAKKYISNEMGLIIFEFELDCTKKNDCIVLRYLKLYQHSEPERLIFLKIDHFLEFQGLMVKLIEGDLLTICSTFELRAPKDFVAFLDLYDKAARSLGTIPLFEIKEKTK